ncbi:MAG: Unknown protein [uncultured Aureispira sp.]|uniref:Uncharacterized protein n=1 Tax=uncultured Aureispira sp. TaxID=1331704 RepID=A0A6S6UCN9_9BACT|nr:MAG: Unknown protein [uncultured Aureispira sp.]
MWLFSRNIDLTALYLPIGLCWLVLFNLPADYLEADIPLWVWVVFVLCIDVGHVWSTIFRTYLDPEEFGQHRQLLIVAPLISFVLVTGLAFISIAWFWRLLAYLALFHFVKQQYGFLALYKMKAKDFGVQKIFQDKWVLYWATLYPVVYWHCGTELNFSWFVMDDFVNIRSFFALSSNAWALLFSGLNAFYWVIMLAWTLEEIFRSDKISTGKILWMLMTAMNWYAGIVYFNSDLVFTVSNVLAHGIPYLTLIIYYQHQKKTLKQNRLISAFQVAAVILPMVFLLAWLEEYCWDMLVYGDRESFFGAVVAYPFELLENPFTQAIAIGLLTLPQLTHYIIDGFIWKSNAANPYVKQIFKAK